MTTPELTNLDHRYSSIRYVGDGGMGEVYQAHHKRLDRDDAIKVLRKRYAEDREFVERFEREAQNAARLNHPSIVAVYDAGEGIFDGRNVPYIAMEYVPGGTLQDLILRYAGPLPVQTAVELALQVARALQVAHQGEVIHRDIKPQNVLVAGSGEAKVADFGMFSVGAQINVRSFRFTEL